MAGWQDVVAGFVSGLGDTAIKIRTALTGIDPAKQAEITQLTMNIEAQAQKAQTDLLAAQIEVNKIEAASSSKFVSWWRPAIGWTGAISLALIYWPKAVVILVLWAQQVMHTGVLTTPPDLGLSDLVGMLGPMLGIAGMRTAEKFKGVAAQ